MYALDTNTVIYFFKDKGHVAQHLFSLPPHEIALPSVVLYELEVGIAKSTSPEKRLDVSFIPFSWLFVLMLYV